MGLDSSSVPKLVLLLVLQNWLVSLQCVLHSHEMRKAFRELREKMKGEGQQLFKYAISTPQVVEIGLLCRIH